MSWKKSKPFFSNSTKKKQHLQLHAGLKGFLCTCNGTEKLCVKEAYSILNEYADILNEKKSNRVGTNKDNSEDIEDQFNNEVEMLNEKKKRFQAVNTSVSNCIFIKTEVEDPVTLVNLILNDLKSTNQKKTRYLIRMVPIEITCYASLSNIKKAAAELFDTNFKDTEPTTFAIVYNCRYNSSVNRETIIEELAAMVTERNKAHKVNLKHSKLTIVVEILKTVCCLSVLPEYNELAKYNLQAVVSDQPSSIGVVGTTLTNVSDKLSSNVDREAEIPRSKRLIKETSSTGISDDDDHVKNDIVKVFICDQKDRQSSDNESNDGEIITTSICEPSIADCDNDEESNHQFKTSEYEVYDEDEEGNASTKRPNADLPTESAKKFKTETPVNSEPYRLGEIQNMTTEKYDDLSNFCVYMSSSLGRLVPDLRFKAQNEIQHIMSKYRIADLQKSPTKSPLNSSVVVKEAPPSPQDSSDEEVWINVE